MAPSAPATTDELTPKERERLEAMQRRARELAPPISPVLIDPSRSTLAPADSSSTHADGAAAPSVPGMEGGGAPAAKPTQTAPERETRPDPSRADADSQWARVKAGEFKIGPHTNEDSPAVGALQERLNKFRSMAGIADIGPLPGPGEHGYSHFGEQTQVLWIKFRAWCNDQKDVKEGKLAKIDESTLVLDARMADALDKSIAQLSKQQPVDKEKKKEKLPEFDADRPAVIDRKHMSPGLTPNDRLNMSLYLRNDGERVDYLHKRGFLVGQDEKGHLVTWKRGESKCYKVDPDGWDSGDWNDMACALRRTGGAVAGGVVGLCAGFGVGGPPGAIFGMVAGATAGSLITERFLLGQGHGKFLDKEKKIRVRDNIDSAEGYGWAALNGALVGAAPLLAAPAVGSAGFAGAVALAVVGVTAASNWGAKLWRDWTKTKPADAASPKK